MVSAHINNYSIAKNTSASFLLLLLAKLDHDYPYTNSLLLHLDGMNQLGTKHLALQQHTDTGGVRTHNLLIVKCICALGYRAPP